ncbi:MAG: hypothetical protein M1834_007276 [Cirrosporium novae-zelandiae]|nr:MAG: hypothetical protein M1834_007276 [Cirrosporium novae-zelandiae]
MLQDNSPQLAATAPFAVLVASCLMGSYHGIGVHTWNLTKGESVEGLKWFFMFEVFYCTSIIPIKLSIAFTLLRIATGRKFYVYGLYVVMFAFTAMNIIAAIYIIAQCSPISYAWDTSTPGGHCNDANILVMVYYVTTAINISTDWFCALLPIPLLWNVKLNRNAKISVAGLLSLGIFASVSGLIRLKYTINLSNSDDYLYGVVKIVIWGYSENGIGMIVGNISTLRPLLQRFFNLGSNASNPPANHQPPWPSNSHRTYQEFQSHELNHQNLQHVSAMETTIKGGGSGGQVGERSNSLSSLGDSESQKRILVGGIVVNRQVDVSHAK